MNTKYAFVTGGVASSLGKGIIAASLAKLLQARGLRAYDCTGMRLPSASDPRVMATSLYDAIWQAGVILLSVKSVGVMGDERTYENPVALRAVVSTDAMTADWFPFPYDFLRIVSNEIIRKVRGVNRVVYDISSKPPATIEWE